MPRRRAHPVRRAAADKTPALPNPIHFGSVLARLEIQQLLRAQYSGDSRDYKATPAVFGSNGHLTADAAVVRRRPAARRRLEEVLEV